jgi:ketosteroid isomerase-like protein
LTADARQLVERLFDALNRRARDEIAGLCHQEVEFVPVAGELAGHATAYRGHAGLADYLHEIERVWDELLLTVADAHADGELILVSGRVYARSREIGLRDLPVTWLWRLKEGLFVYGRMFDDPAEALHVLRAGT